MEENGEGFIVCASCLNPLVDEPMAKWVSISGQFENGHLYCADCYTEQVQPQFFKALANENDWPPSFGAVKALDPGHLPGFSSEFVKAYAEAVKLYKVLGASRIYCCHRVHKDSDNFAGNALMKTQFPFEDTVLCQQYNGVKNQMNKPISCSKCGGKLCNLCGDPMWRGIDHTCPEPEAEPEGRGLVFQDCPTCRRRAALLDGCNALTYKVCQTDYCYLCGVEADHDSDHWLQPSICPRFGRGEQGVFDESDDIPDEDEEPLQVDDNPEEDQPQIQDADGNHAVELQVALIDQVEMLIHETRLTNEQVWRMEIVSGLLREQVDRLKALWAVNFEVGHSGEVEHGDTLRLVIHDLMMDATHEAMDAITLDAGDEVVHRAIGFQLLMKSFTTGVEKVLPAKELLEHGGDIPAEDLVRFRHHHMVTITTSKMLETRGAAEKYPLFVRVLSDYSRWTGDRLG